MRNNLLQKSTYQINKIVFFMTVYSNTNYFIHFSTVSDAGLMQGAEMMNVEGGEGPDGKMQKTGAEELKHVSKG
jgi:hypothetical protein